jgi:hypothetical protein
MALGPYLTPHIERFCVLGGFGEEVEEIAGQGKIRAPKLWNGTLVIGIDYDLEGASILINKAEQKMHAALCGVQEGFERGSRAQINFLLRAIGHATRGSVYYFE